MEAWGPDVIRVRETLNAEFADAYFYLGFSRLGLNDTEGAQENLQKYIEVSPADAPNVPTAQALLQKLAPS